MNMIIANCPRQYHPAPDRSVLRRLGRAGVLALALGLFVLAPPAARAQQSGPPPGWDAAKWSDPSHRTPKYVIGRILVKHPHTPEGLKQALPEIRKAYPGTTILGSKGDKISVPGVGVVDVIQAAGEGGKAWQWLPVEESAPKPVQKAVRQGANLGLRGKALIAHGAGPLPGWDANKWFDPNERSPKYVIGRILIQHPPTPEGLREALPEIRKAFPGTTIVGSKGDKLQIPGVGILDVIRSAGAGGGAWQWVL